MNIIGKLTWRATGLALLPTILSVSDSVYDVITDNQTLDTYTFDENKKDRLVTRKVEAVKLLTFSDIILDENQITFGVKCKACLSGVALISTAIAVPYGLGRVSAIASQRLFSYFSK